VNDDAKAAEVEAAASAACTRSGAFALLLSVVLVLLIPYWINLKNELALSHYQIARLNLTLQFETLDDDPVWQRYKASQPSAESMSIDQLLGASVAMPTISSDESKPPSLPVPTGEHKPGPPGALRSPHPPRMLTVTPTETLREMPVIAGLLAQLNDSELLTRTRNVSTYFNVAVARWLTKRNELVYRHAVIDSCTAHSLEVPHERPNSASFVPALYPDVLLKCLTLGDVRILAQFELPTLPDPMYTGGRAEKEIEMTPGSLPRDPYVASIVADALLFFMVIYFDAFAHQATSSPSFPAPGTVFSAFSRGRLTLLVFLLALWSPLLASISVAATSRKGVLILCSLPILFAVASAHLTLQRKSYFFRLTPRYFLAPVFRKRA
jgi:hypothetical protein